MVNKKWHIINQHDVSPSPWFPVVQDEVRLPDGSVIDYYKSNLANVSMIVPITKNREVVLVRQYKHGVGEVCLEFPAGRIEAGHTPQQTAVRELKEETGIEVSESDLIGLIELWTEPSKSTVRVFGFLVKDVSITEQQELEKTEDIELVLVPIEKLDEWLASGELHASDTVALLLWARSRFPAAFVWKMYY